MSEAHSAEKDVPVALCFYPFCGKPATVVNDGGLWCEHPHPLLMHPLYPCSTGGCPGDGRYAAPGRLHHDDCTHPGRVFLPEATRP